MRQTRERRRCDILNLVLKNLPIGEGIFCTPHTFDNISDRVELFRTIYNNRTYITFRGDGVQNIKRVA